MMCKKLMVNQISNVVLAKSGKKCYSY